MPQLPWLFCGVALLVAPGSLAAQWQTPPDAHDFSKVKGADSALVTWVERDNANVHLIKMRNNFRHPAEIVEWEIYDCFNIRSKDCGQHAKVTRIEPGQTITLQAVRRDHSRSAWRWRYRFRSRFLTPPEESVVMRGGTVPPEIAAQLRRPHPGMGRLVARLQQQFGSVDVRLHTGRGEMLELGLRRPTLPDSDATVEDSLRAVANFAARHVPEGMVLDSIRVRIETASDGGRTTTASRTFPWALLRPPESPDTTSPPARSGS